MSSPMQSLKKGSRSPNLPGHISGHRPIPFRHPEYSEDESRLLEEITTSMVASRMRARDPFATTIIPKMDSSPNPSLREASNNNSDAPVSESDSSTLPPPSNRELMKLMMARLTIMEQKVQSQEQEIKTKDRRIKVLEDKLHIMNKARQATDNNLNNDDNAGVGIKEENNCNNSQRRVAELEQHCLLLQQQVHEMETFLADYGMVWVGEQDDPTSDIYVDDDDPDDVRAKKQRAAGLELDDAAETTGEPFAIDFDRLFENIRDLNVIAGEGEARVYHTTDGARLMRPENVPITFYANGLIMFDGPFRPYTDPFTVQCVQDFMDGYFPSELQTRYPEGVPFSARDMRSVHYKPVKGTDVFSGVGLTLGGETMPSRLIPSRLRDMDYSQHAAASTSTSTSTGGAISQTTDPGLGKPMKVDQFLGKLPKSVVKDGKVIDIRSSVGKQLSGSEDLEQKQPQATLVETTVTKALQKTVSEAKVDRPKTPRDITTLRIKSENGNHTYIVKMRFGETVGDLRRYLNEHRAGESKDYDICATYPRKVFTDEKATMEASGLVPNGVLYLQVKKKT